MLVTTNNQLTTEPCWLGVFFSFSSVNMAGSPIPTILGVLVRGWNELFVSGSSLYARSNVSNKSEIFLILTLVSSSLEVRSEASLASVMERKRKIVSQKCYYRTEQEAKSKMKARRKILFLQNLCDFYVLWKRLNCVCSMFYLAD